MTIDEMIAVLQAAKDGKPIQVRAIGHSLIWTEGLPLKELSWDFSRLEYRVKPEPKEYWIAIAQGGAPVQIALDRINAERIAEGWPNSTVIHVREVID